MHRAKYLTRKSFTLIEMLIVIVIIGILASALIPRLQSIQSRARDTKRKVDIVSIWNAIQIYKTDLGVNPMPGNGCGYNESCQANSMSGIAWLNSITGYIHPLPIDPINTGTAPRSTTGHYFYWYGQVWQSGRTAHLASKLENTKDSDRCEVQGYQYDVNGSVKTCQTVVSCGAIFCLQMYIRSDLGL